MCECVRDFYLMRISPLLLEMYGTRTHEYLNDKKIGKNIFLIQPKKAKNILGSPLMCFFSPLTSECR